MKSYTIKRVVVEYYSIEANSKKEALAMALEDPYYIEVKSEHAFLDRPSAPQQSAALDGDMSYPIIGISSPASDLRR